MEREGHRSTRRSLEEREEVLGSLTCRNGWHSCPNGPEYLSILHECLGYTCCITINVHILLQGVGQRRAGLIHHQKVPLWSMDLFRRKCTL